MKDTNLKFLHIIKSFDFLRPGDILNDSYPVLDISEDEIILGKGNSGEIYAIINKLDSIAVTGETDINNLPFYYCIHSFNDFLEVMSRYKEDCVLELYTFDHRTFISSSSLDIVGTTNDEIYIILSGINDYNISLDEITYSKKIKSIIKEKNVKNLINR